MAVLVSTTFLVLSFLAIFQAAPVKTAPLSTRGSLSYHDIALDAQELNSYFAALGQTDTCKDGEKVCIGGKPADCVGQRWVVVACPTSGTSCFALPYVNSPEVVRECTTIEDAIARFEVAGATGGPTGNEGVSANTPGGDDESECVGGPAPDDAVNSAAGATHSYYRRISPISTITDTPTTSSAAEDQASTVSPTTAAVSQSTPVTSTPTAVSVATSTPATASSASTGVLGTGEVVTVTETTTIIQNECTGVANSDSTLTGSPSPQATTPPVSGSTSAPSASGASVFTTTTTVTSSASDPASPTTSATTTPDIVVNGISTVTETITVGA